MSRTKAKSERNLEYAQRWLARATKDFDAFKRLVRFDKNTYKAIRCFDPALAVYFLQQSVEKAVKAAAIASRQYKTNDFVNYYRHNSLALMLNLHQRIITKIDQLGLKPMADLMGIDLANGTIKLMNIENQVMGKPNSPVLTEKKVDFREESIRVSPQVIDKMLDMIIAIRSSFLDAIRSAFGHLPEMGIRKGHGTVEDPEAFVRKLSDRITCDLKARLPSEAQLKALIEFVKYLSNLGVQAIEGPNRTKTITNYLGVWALSTALLFLTYFTFAHESTSRYPQKPRRINKATVGKIDCDDYDENLGIVNRIGRMGYVTSLTLNDMKQELEAIAIFFSAIPLTLSPMPKGDGHKIP